MNAAAIQAVRDTLQLFQDGYTRRETGTLDEFRALFVADDDLEVIGTGGIDPGGDEWCLGTDAALDLVKNDWEGWGDLLLAVADARIHVVGEVAWLATTGTVTMDLEPQDTYRDFLAYLRETNLEDEQDPRARLLEILRGAANTIFEAERGKRYHWPLRFSAVLVRQEAHWLFHQVQFSFATTRFPDVREDSP